MQWEQLLSLRKFGDVSKRIRLEESDTRLGFEVDYDRIIFSSAFRSLQDKTQVIPLSKTDFVHTRLTHSLEVSVVGRSLGRLAGKKILEKYPHLNQVHGYQINDFGAIVAAASLSHDIGNPPFGHSGEKAIGDYFAHGPGKSFQHLMSPAEWQDLVDFEGNANGFSVLASSRPGSAGGLRISYATLGAFMKYPKASLPKKPSLQISDKKYGVFQRDLPYFEDVVRELGMLAKPAEHGYAYHRHPLAFLVEAADDICYTIIDFEDGLNLGLIPEDYALEYMIKLVKDTINTDNYYKQTTKEDRISYLRALAIGNLINDAVRVFIENEEAILRGEFHQSLLSKSKYKAQMEDIIQISVNNVYQSREVVAKELNGYHIIHTLLDKFIGATNRRAMGMETSYDNLLWLQLPERYQIEKESLYERLLQICQFVANLTDGNAVRLYQTLANGRTEF